MKSEAERFAQHQKLETFTGRVSSLADRHHSTTVSTSRNPTTTVNTTPEIWVSNEAGHERRFIDATVAECRLGHQVTIAFENSKEAVLAMHNHSTSLTWFTPKLSIRQTDGSYFVGMIATVIVFFLLSLFVSMLLFGDSIGRRSWWADLGASLLQISAVAFGVWSSERGRRKHNFKTVAYRTRIQAELSSKINI